MAGSPHPGSWRKELRQRLLAWRQALEEPVRRHMERALQAHLGRLVDGLPGPFGLYWPIRGEFDPRPLARDLLGRDCTLALPVIVGRGQPLAFWRWDPDMPMQPGVWGIPVPSRPDPVEPRTLIIPCVGYDRQGYRLGYGGGYYDRTLASLEPRPLAIGLACAFSRLDSIRPEPHDQKLDVVVTEGGIEWFRKPLDGR